jgi:hypothetical protein
MSVPLTLAEANNAIAVWHRHHQPVQGYRFAIGAINAEGQLVGVAVAGRPVARMAGDPRAVCEVTRLATDGTRNACSFLYGACARAAKAMGFTKIQTYILEEETGASLAASNWKMAAESSGGSWSRSNRPRTTEQPTGPKRRYELDLNQDRPDVVLAAPQETDAQLSFGEAA